MGKPLEVLRTKTPVDEAWGVVRELWDDAIGQLVELGREREKFDDSAKAAANSAIMGAIYSLPRAQFDEFNDLVNHYRPLDNDLANFIAGFNIITQYADFELLRKQNPPRRSGWESAALSPKPPSVTLKCCGGEQ
ncbi:MAG: hypothetical protein Kow0069_32830 [Promethearchaeota archaeon]